MGEPASGDSVFIGKRLGPLASGQTRQVFLRVIIRADGSVVGGKTTVQTGSELHIIEPDYILWDAAEELYPFIFETVGDWTVTTTVAPPEGFVPDADSLTADVQSELEAVQFTITDVGSKWVPTGICHQVTHGGKEEQVDSAIGVKLTPSLAAEKNLTVYGDPKETKEAEREKKQEEKEAAQEAKEWCKELLQEEKQEQPKGKKK